MSTGMINNTNLFSLSTLISTGRNSEALNESITKLSTGLQINSFMDDAAGMSISEKMRGYILGLQTASENAQDAISYLQTAEGAATEINSMLQRIRELAVQAANGTYTANDRQEIQKEIDQLLEEIDRIAESTEYNSQTLLNGSSSGVWNSSSEKITAVVNGAVESGNYEISVSVEAGLNQVQSSQIFTINDGELGATVSDSGTTNIAIARDPENINDTTTASYTVTISNLSDGGVAGTTIDSSISLVSSYKISDNSDIILDDTQATITTNESGYFLIEFTENTIDATNSATYQIKFISAETGEEGAWVEMTAVNGVLSGTYISNGFNITFDDILIFGSIVNNGDKFLLAVTDSKNVSNGDDLLSTGGGAITISQGDITGPTIVFNESNSLTQADDYDGTTDYNDVTVYMVTLDENGAFQLGELTFGFQETDSGATSSGVATIDVRSGGDVATATTRLSELANFVDENGVSVFAATQSLTIYGNNTSATIYLEGSDTIQDLVDKLTTAIVEDLGMGSGFTNVDKNLVTYNEVEGVGFGTVPGTMILQSALTGLTGEISFSGDEDLLNALGLEVVQESKQNIQTVTAKNMYTGEVVGEVVTDTSRVSDIISGIDIVIDSRTGVDASYNVATGTLEFSSSNRLENQNLYLHIVDTGTKIQIGTEKGETLDISLPDLTTTALGISNLNVNTTENAQRAITEIDNALAKVTSARTKIGAYITRLESTMSVLSTTEENTVSSESRIRDTDIASETTNYTAAQVAYQMNLSILAQANQIPALVLALLEN